MEFLSRFQRDAAVRIILVLPALLTVGLVVAGLVGNSLNDVANHLVGLDADLKAWWTVATP